MGGLGVGRGIEAKAAVDRVGTCAAVDRIVAGAAIDRIVAGAAVDDVGPSEPEDRVGAATTRDGIGLGGDAVGRIDRLGEVCSNHGSHGPVPFESIRAAHPPEQADHGRLGHEPLFPRERLRQ